MADQQESQVPESPPIPTEKTKETEKEVPIEKGIQQNKKRKLNHQHYARIACINEDNVSLPIVTIRAQSQIAEIIEQAAKDIAKLIENQKDEIEIHGGKFTDAIDSLQKATADFKESLTLPHISVAEENEKK